MANCPNCGAPVADNAQGCNACGYRFPQRTAPVAKAPAKAAYAQPVCDNIDIAHNRGYAFISYFSILWLVPLFFAKHSKFARYHCNQGLLVFILGTVLSIISSIFSAITGAIIGFLGELLEISYSIISIINGVISGGFGFIVSAVVIALMVIGLINVFKGRCKPLPVLGKITIIKY